MLIVRVYLTFFEGSWRTSKCIKIYRKKRIHRLFPPHYLIVQKPKTLNYHLEQIVYLSKVEYYNSPSRLRRGPKEVILKTRILKNLQILESINKSPHDWDHRGFIHHCHYNYHTFGNVPVYEIVIGEGLLFM